MKRLGWIRPATAQSLCETLELRLVAWLKEWSASQDQVDQRPRVAVMQTVEDSLDTVHWRIATTNVGGLFGIRLRSASCSALGAELMGLSSAADTQLCGSVGEDALQALLDALVGNHISDSVGRSQQIDNDRFAPRHGAFRATAHWDAFEVEVIADAVWCASESDSIDRTVRSELTSRHAALLNQSVGLDAQLIVGEVELGEVSTLRIGEVLIVDSDAHAPLHLMNGNQVLAAARLVVVQGQRALELH
ncbi:hypothetical protein XdyCFBP7245_20270 [Xanthomonas dyei]|uniref:Flagellar motor switch protein FliN-like C-terminal domain-containing protein n=1 Tax=Xanthomonas dyei TaxID=743699 RepID=A0A2S7BXK2_9XANT|nr:hypothetical protein XdyCFBP7245_20270 [Xanthomonas dyei]